MGQSERRNRIIEYLRIKPISHGQVHTFQIAVPELLVEDISAERHEALKSSLVEHGSNLVPVLVRRTEDYGEEEEYEVVYGADWCLVAKELDIERLWVWVFDMTDEQAVAAKAEMEQLVGFSLSSQKPAQEQQRQKVVDYQPDAEQINIESMLSEKLQPIIDMLNKQLSASPTSVESYFDNRLRDIDSKIEGLVAVVRRLVETVEYAQPKPQKLNLLTAKAAKIEDVLQEYGVSSNSSRAAFKAIEYWKTSDQGLTWTNLKKSATAKKTEKDKIKDFGKTTYEKLKEVGYIP